jgi:hypothetical protein
LAANWKPHGLLNTHDEIRLEDIDEKIALMLQGKLKGRTIINMEKKSIPTSYISQSAHFRHMK